jgi:hypothetical protein
MDLLSIFYGHPITFDPIELAMVYFLFRLNAAMSDMKIQSVRREAKLDGLARDFHVERQNTEQRFKRLEPVLRKV